MSKTQGVTLTIIFEAQSLNYDEGYGNLSILKKFHRGDGRTYTYSSRQSIRYSIFAQGQYQFGWVPSQVESAGAGDSKVIQLVSDIKDSIESDLFGFMQTNVTVSEKPKLEATRTRVAPVKITPAISLEPFDSDVEMLTNKYQADKNMENPNIANIENHRSLYRYTVCIDLHRIGSEADEIANKVMPNGKDDKKHKDQYLKYVEKIRANDIGNDSKAKRVSELLEVIGSLYRDIKGRREDLKPLFVIGGVYDVLNPFFENTVFVKYDGMPRIDPTSISQQLLSSEEFAKSTFIGMRNGFFANKTSDFDGAIESNVGSPEDVIKSVKDKVIQYYS